MERLCHLHTELGLEPDLLTPEPEPRTTAGPASPYGNISVKGHGDKKHHLHTTNDMDEEDLCDAASKGDDFMFSEKVINHLWRDDRRNSQVNEGEVGQQKVHGGV